MPALAATSSNQIGSGFGRAEGISATSLTDPLRCLEQAVRRHTVIEAHPTLVMSREGIIAMRPLCPARRGEPRAVLILALAGRVFGPEQWRCARDRIGEVEALLRPDGCNPRAAQNSTRGLFRRT